jgi:hypothetical protein
VATVDASRPGQRRPAGARTCAAGFEPEEQSFGPDRRRCASFGLLLVGGAPAGRARLIDGQGGEIITP